jgi:hypothetical protein
MPTLHLWQVLLHLDDLIDVRSQKHRKHSMWFSGRSDPDVFIEATRRGNRGFWLGEEEQILKNTFAPLKQRLFEIYKKHINPSVVKGDIKPEEQFLIHGDSDILRVKLF